eukprot:scaffold73385_cov31-Tisochrysis_lutea.AAC.5
MSAPRSIMPICTSKSIGAPASPALAYRMASSRTCDVDTKARSTPPRMPCSLGCQKVAGSTPPETPRYTRVTRRVDGVNRRHVAEGAAVSKYLVVLHEPTEHSVDWMGSVNGSRRAPAILSERTLVPYRAARQCLPRGGAPARLAGAARRSCATAARRARAES